MLRTVIIIALIALVIRAFIIQPFYVLGPSMQPTYSQGDYLLIDELTYHVRAPHRGEVIVLKYPRDTSKDFIKRIIGLPGETIKVADGSVYINSKKLNEPYLHNVNTDGSLELTLSDKEYFVLGDNRPVSSDSRIWGTLPRSDIVGKVLIQLWPPSNFGTQAHFKYNISKT